MELWVAFAFGAAVGVFAGVLLGRHRAARRAGAAPPPVPSAAPLPRRSPVPPVQRVVLDEGSANVLNALNNRLAAIGALADLLHGSPLDPERARALMMLHGEVRRAAEITQHFLELAQHPIGAAEPSDCAIVLNGLLAERDAALQELGVKLIRKIPRELPMVACPMAQLSEMFLKLLDFSLRRLRDARPPRELVVTVAEAGPAVSVALWDSGPPLSIEAEERLVTPFRFTQSASGGEIEFALARALAQSSGGTLRLRPRPGGGAEVVVTLPKSVLAPLARATPPVPALPRLRILVVDDDAVNRQAMRLPRERPLRRGRHRPPDAPPRRPRAVRAARRAAPPARPPLRVRHRRPRPRRHPALPRSVRPARRAETLRVHRAHRGHRQGGRARVVRASRGRRRSPGCRSPPPSSAPRRSTSGLRGRRPRRSRCSRRGTAGSRRRRSRRARRIARGRTRSASPESRSSSPRRRCSRRTSRPRARSRCSCGRRTSRRAARPPPRSPPPRTDRPSPAPPPRGGTTA